MKVLVATHETQGQRKNDFAFATDGELVTFGFECDGETIDGACGCRRSMSGVESLVATTTVKVIEREGFGVGLLARALFAGSEKGGWVKLMGKDAIREQSRADAEILKSVARAFPVGAVLEKRGEKFVLRQVTT